MRYERNKDDGRGFLTKEAADCSGPIIYERRGPPPTGKGTLIGVRVQPDDLAALDAWIADHGPKLTRA